MAHFRRGKKIVSAYYEEKSTLDYIGIYGGIAFLLIYFTKLNSVYKLDWTTLNWYWSRHQENKSKKGFGSIPINELECNCKQLKSKGGYIKYKICCICGRKGEMHHYNAIGMGRNRSKIDDKDLRKMQLSRIHHTKIETIGRDSFEKKYHVYGVIYREE